MKSNQGLIQGSAKLFHPPRRHFVNNEQIMY